MDRRPDAPTNRTRRRRPAGLVGRNVDDLAHRAEIVDRNDDLDVEGFANSGVDDPHRPGAEQVTVGVDAVAAEEVGDLGERPLRCGESDALWRVVGELVESFQGEREMRTAFGGRDGVDLVDDDGGDRPQRLAGGAGNHEVQRLRCGDEDVGRVRNQPSTVLSGGVAGAHADGGLPEVPMRQVRFVLDRHQPLGGEHRPADGGAKVLLDVDRQGA